MISTPHGAGVKETRAGVRGGVRARASSPPPVRLPRISVGCGSYRTLTSDSVYLESEESTLNATTTDDV